MEYRGRELHGNHHGRPVLRGQGIPLCWLPCYGRFTDDWPSLSSCRRRAESVCTDVSTDFFKKFLAEGPPIESHLPTHLLHDYFLVEIAVKTIENKQEAMVMELLKSHMHLTQYIDQVCIICGSVKVTLCPLTSSVDGVRTCTTPSTHISVDLVIVL